MSETYSISVICHNCHHVPSVIEETTDGILCSKQFSIAKGTDVKTFLRGMVCPNCGCDGYMGLHS